MPRPDNLVLPNLPQGTAKPFFASPVPGAGANSGPDAMPLASAVDRSARDASVPVPSLAASLSWSPAGNPRTPSHGMRPPVKIDPSPELPPRLPGSRSPGTPSLSSPQSAPSSAAGEIYRDSWVATSPPPPVPPHRGTRPSSAVSSPGSKGGDSEHYSTIRFDDNYSRLPLDNARRSNSSDAAPGSPASAAKPPATPHGLPGVVGPRTGRFSR